MLTAFLGLASAFIYGSADFLGGLASKRISPIRVTALSAIGGLVILLFGMLVIPAEWSWSAVGWGALSGVSGSVAIALLYACLAIGPMSILSPVTAVLAAIVPATWALVGGEALGPLGGFAIALALVAVVLVGFVPEKGAVRPTLRGLMMAIGSGVMIGVFMILIDLTPADSGLIPLVFNRAVNGVLMFGTVGVLAAVALRRRTSAARGLLASPAHTHGEGSRVAGGVVVGAEPAALSSGWRAGFWLAILVGVLDAAANALILTGIRLGDLSVMSVLTALYPAGTIVLAALVLRERIAVVQWVGLALALVAAALLAVA